MTQRLTNDAAHWLKEASAALRRAASGAVEAQPSNTRRQDDEIAKAVFAEIETARNLINRAEQTPSSQIAAVARRSNMWRYPEIDQSAKDTGKEEGD